MAAELRLISSMDTAPDPGSPEGHLIRRSLEGDSAAFAELYSHYRPAVYATCVRQLRDRDLAEDAVQDTFVRAFTCLDTFTPGRKLLPWLRSIAIRRCIDLQRRGSHSMPVDPAGYEWPQRTRTDTTIESVLSAEDRQDLERALSRLPSRQRRALLLQAVEGWSYADIAAAEGLSISSTRSLLFRARAGLRLAWRGSAAYGFVLLPFRRLRGRAERIMVGARARVDGVGEPALASSMQSISAAFMLLAATVLYPTSHVIFSTTDGSTRIPVSRAVSFGGSPGPGRAAARLARGPDVDPLSVARTTERLGADVLHPTDGATPEDTRFSSIVVSPAYGRGRDRTVFAAGQVRCVRQTLCSVLFRSIDGGTTWTRLDAKGFLADKLILPPSYPSDRRIFAMGPAGLQQSDDGGASFRIVNPLVGDIAISPNFNSDPRIMIASTAIMEYWADRGLIKPATLTAVGVSDRMTVAFSPAYPRQEVILVGNMRPDSKGQLHSNIQRCERSACIDAYFDETRGVPSLKLSPTFASDGTAYAFTQDSLSRSDDGGVTFRRLGPPGRGMLQDLTLYDGNPAAQILLAGVAGAEGGGVYRSSDRGASWTGSSVGIPRFERGVGALAIAATGRLFAGSNTLGIACSNDAGMTWAARCVG